MTEDLTRLAHLITETEAAVVRWRAVRTSDPGAQKQEIGNALLLLLETQRLLQSALRQLAPPA